MHNGFIIGGGFMNNFGFPGMIPGQMMVPGFPNQTQPGQNNGLTINGDFDLTIVNHRDFGGGGLGSNGFATIMSQQMMQMQQLMLASRQSDMARLEVSKELLSLEMKKEVITNLLSSSVSDEFKTKLLELAMKTEEVGSGDEINHVLIENKSPEGQPSKTVWGKASAETVDVEIIKDHEVDVQRSPPESKTNPYAEYFAREDLKRDINKHLLEQMDAYKAGELPTAFVTQMRERLGLRFDIAHVLKTKTSAWRKSIRKAISNQPNSHIVVKGEYPTQDYLVFIYDVIGKPYECVYVSAIPLHRYYAASEIENEFESRLREIAAINLILKEEFPNVSSFTHIIEPVIQAKSMTVYIKNVESNDVSEFDMDSVSTVSINGTTEPPVQISIEMYSRAIRKYKVN